MENGDYESALAYFQQAYDLSQLERFAKYYRADIAWAKGCIASRNGSSAAKTGDYRTALRCFEEAASLQPKVKGYKKQIAWAKGELEAQQGDEASRNGDRATALAHYKRAELLWPEDVYRTVIARVSQEVKDEKARKRQDEEAVAKIQDSIQRVAGELASTAPKQSSASLDFAQPDTDAASASAKAGTGEDHTGLDFVDASPSTPESEPPLRDAVNDTPSDKDVGPGSAGYNVAKVRFATVAPAKPGSDTKAGDQALAAAGVAGKNGDLTPLYDIGGVKSAGSLARPSEPPIDPATFSTRVRNDRRMIDALAQLGDLNADRSKLDAELLRLTTAMKQAKDPKTMAEINRQVDQKNGEFQANLLAITKAEEKVKKVHRTIDAEVAKPAGAPVTNADSAANTTAVNPDATASPDPKGGK
jgi:tetratricopeptide (TPR) repeat protein